MNSRIVFSKFTKLSASKPVSRLRRHSTDLSENTDEACKKSAAAGSVISSLDEMTVSEVTKHAKKARNTKKKADPTGRTKYSHHSKTDFCQAYLQESGCPYEDKCLFAHSLNELRPMGSLESYKIKPCLNFSTKSFCSYGYKCQYAHEVDCPPLLTFEALLKKKAANINEEVQKKENEQIKLLSLLKFLHTRETFKPRRLQVFCNLE